MREKREENKRMQQKKGLSAKGSGEAIGWE